MNKLLRISFFIIILTHTFLFAEERTEYDFAKLLISGDKIRTGGTIIIEDENNVFLSNNEKKLQLVFPDKSYKLEKEIINADFIYIEGIIEDNIIAVKRLNYNDKLIEFSSNGITDSKKFDIFIDYDGDGICDRRNNKLLFGDNILKKYKSYYKIFGNTKNLKSSGSHSKQKRNSGGHGGNSGNNHGGKN